MLTHFQVVVCYASAIVMTKYLAISEFGDQYMYWWIDNNAHCLLCVAAQAQGTR